MSVPIKSAAAEINGTVSNAPANGVSPKMLPEVSSAGPSALKNQVAQGEELRHLLREDHRRSRRGAELGRKSNAIQGEMDKSALFNRMDHGRGQKLGAGEKLGEAVRALNELFDVGQSLGAAMSQWKLGPADNKEYFDAQKKGIIAKLKQVKEKVRQLEMQIIAIEGTKNVAAWKPGLRTMPGRVAQQ